MAINRTMEDWFLRGGEKPQENGMQTVQMVAVAVCQNCGGENLADEEYCTHCGAPMTGGTPTDEYCGDDEYKDEDGERKFTVTVRRTQTVLQEAKLKVRADCEESAMEKAEDIAEEDDEIDWDNVPDSDEYEDLEAIDAEEL